MLDGVNMYGRLLKKLASAHTVARETRDVNKLGFYFFARPAHPVCLLRAPRFFRSLLGISN